MSTTRSRSVGYEVSAFLRNGTLVDCGFADAESDLASLLAAYSPRGVLLTHHHEDHAGNVEYVAQRGIPVAAPAETLTLLRARPTMGFYRRFVWGTPRVLSAPVAPFEPEGLQLIPAPGHSPDHHVAWHADSRTLFSADLFLGMKVRVARPGEDPRALARSLREIASLEPATMLDSHRGLVPNPVSALLAKADWLDETIARVDALRRSGMNEHAIRREVLGPEDAAYWFSAGDLSRINFVRAILRAG